jgi:hypothetical protein
MKICKICGKEIAYNGCKYIHAKIIHGSMYIKNLPKHEAILKEKEK